MEIPKQDLERSGQDDRSRKNDASADPHPLHNVLAPSTDISDLTIYTGLFNLGRNRALQSGTTEPLAEDTAALENHARAAAKKTHRDRFDPTKITHDRMREAEYQKWLADRNSAESAEAEAAANARDAEQRLAETPKAGAKPITQLPLVISGAFVITLTVAPTLHDLVFFNLDDDLLAHFFSFLSAACVGSFISWAILTGRRTS